MSTRSSTKTRPGAAPAGPSLTDLTRQVERAEGFPEILAALRAWRSATIDGAWGSAGPLATAAVANAQTPGSTVLVVLAHVGDLDDFRDDLASFSGLEPEVFPAWDRTP